MVNLVVPPLGRHLGRPVGRAFRWLPKPCPAWGYLDRSDAAFVTQISFLSRRSVAASDGNR